MITALLVLFWVALCRFGWCMVQSSGEPLEVDRREWRYQAWFSLLAAFFFLAAAWALS